MSNIKYDRFKRQIQIGDLAYWTRSDMVILVVGFTTHRVKYFIIPVSYKLTDKFNAETTDLRNIIDPVNCIIMNELLQDELISHNVNMIANQFKIEVSSTTYRPIIRTVTTDTGMDILI